jgi:hypothetical protein
MSVGTLVAKCCCGTGEDIEYWELTHCEGGQPLIIHALKSAYPDAQIGDVFYVEALDACYEITALVVGQYPSVMLGQEFDTCEDCLAEDYMILEQCPEAEGCPTPDGTLLSVPVSILPDGWENMVWPIYEWCWQPKNLSATPEGEILGSLPNDVPDCNFCCTCTTCSELHDDYCNDNCPSSVQGTISVSFIYQGGGPEPVFKPFDFSATFGMSKLSDCDYYGVENNYSVPCPFGGDPSLIYVELGIFVQTYVNGCRIVFGGSFGVPTTNEIDECRTGPNVISGIGDEVDITDLPCLCADDYGAFVQTQYLIENFQGTNADYLANITMSVG